MENVFREDAMVLAWKRRGYFCAYVILRKWTTTDGDPYWVPVMNHHGETELFDSAAEARSKKVQINANDYIPMNELSVRKIGIIS